MKALVMVKTEGNTELDNTAKSRKNQSYAAAGKPL
jgi:hypothetical protein